MGLEASFHEMDVEREESNRKIQILAEKVREYMKDEEALKDALLGAQKQGHQVIAEANEKAAQILDKAKEEGIIEKVITTNLTYQTPELLSRDWYISADMSKYIAYIIDTLNHDSSISDLLNPSERIQRLLRNHTK